jgi:beta-glucosidase
MQSIKYVFTVIMAVIPYLLFSQIVETQNALDLRLNSLLAKMSMQEKIEQLYYKTDGNTRLGIPAFKGSDGPHGIGNKAKGFSCFPVTIGMAATWDPALITRVGRAISEEQVARGRDRIAGPALDLLIDPRMGRAAETIGEDPFLGGRISEAFIQGQNTTSVFGSIKHYNLNTYEINRRTNNYLIDRRSLVEFWGLHWKRAIQFGGAMSVMCAYNWINGDKCAENEFLIKNLLRNQWGFGFYTMSDWGGFSSTSKALNAELDFCEGNDLYIKELPIGVEKGLFDSSLVNRAVKNVLRTKLLSGMIDGVPVSNLNLIDSKEHRNLVYESGLKSLILLKNQQNILPLKKDKFGSIALIGPNAASLPLDGNSSSKVLPSYRITVEAALKNMLGDENVNYIKGCNINDTTTSSFAAAIQAAKTSNYVVFVAGLDSTIEGEGYFLDKEADEKGGGAVTRPDRVTKSVMLPTIQMRLIHEISKVNPNIILVVISGGPCSITPILKDIKALIYAFYPGQEAGRAIVDVLLGKYNPSGKLPATIPKNDAQIIPISPDFRNMAINGVGYRWFDNNLLEPEFVFGSGLSYTQFEYSNITVNKRSAKVGDEIIVSFNLKNTGNLVGEEVAQLYLSTGKLTSNITMPKKQLKGFKKVSLNPGQTKILQFILSPEEFYVFDSTINSYQVIAGNYIAKVGGASDQLSLSVDFSLEKAIAKPDLFITNIRSMPTYPKEGEEVVFMASIINNGTAPTNIGKPLKVQFYIDGKEVANYISKSVSIPIGGMELTCAQGLNNINWKATKGNYSITAKVSLLSETELNNDNNLNEAKWNIPNGKIVSKEIASMIEKSALN